MSLAIPGVLPDNAVEDPTEGELITDSLDEPVVKFNEEGEPSEESLTPQPQQTEAEGSPGPEAPAGGEKEPDIEGTPDEIAQKYKSLQGQFGHLNGEIKDLRSELDAATDFFAGLRRSGVIDEDGNILPQKAKAPEGEPEPESKSPGEFSIADVVDYGFVSDRLSEAIASGDRKAVDESIAGLLVAVEKYVKGVREKDRAEFSKEMEPFRQTDLQMKVMNQAAALFKKVGSTYDEKAGAYVYPELREPEKADQILQIWQTYTPEHAMTPRGVYDAWLEWNHRNGHFNASPPPPPPRKTNVGGANELLENKQKARKTATETVLGGGGAPVVTPHTNTGTTDQLVAAFRRRVRESARPIGNLGFTE